MDVIQTASLLRAKGAIDMALGEGQVGPSARVLAKAFTEYAWLVLKAGAPERVGNMLASSTNSLVQKAAVPAHGTGDAELAGHSTDLAALAAAYIGSIAEGNLLDQIARYARVLPRFRPSVLLASGTSAEATAEGGAKVVKRLALSIDEEAADKVAAIVVMTREMEKAAGLAMFENELRLAITRAVNERVLANLMDSNAISAAAGADPLATLRNALQAAGPSHGYVAAVTTGDAAWLATCAENRGGMGVRGGDFCPGISIVAVDNLAAEMVVIPASRAAVWDGGLEVRSSGQATVIMADDPVSPGQMVSLWQTNSVGLLAERHFVLAGDVQAVVVGS